MSLINLLSDKTLFIGDVLRSGLGCDDGFELGIGIFKELVIETEGGVPSFLILFSSQRSNDSVLDPKPCPHLASRTMFKLLDDAQALVGSALVNPSGWSIRRFRRLGDVGSGRNSKKKKWRKGVTKTRGVTETMITRIVPRRQIWTALGSCARSDEKER
ncbi:hypothetical protein K435DRAFT_796604 [Dendrothele bispora CBS 962.96]|uniref:Uncharacterized protein n=1 Tax=Dendrothele bispora (strain CBS 962.96) TaxID=1314807 RepID=A0A4S8M5N1_DENBC|nr:hypothetical protein K435DRAFT_796604 [Dendrothele bispora CBS 962.96]